MIGKAGAATPDHWCWIETEMLARHWLPRLLVIGSFKFMLLLLAGYEFRENAVETHRLKKLDPCDPREFRSFSSLFFRYSEVFENCKFFSRFFSRFFS